MSQPAFGDLRSYLSSDDFFNYSAESRVPSNSYVLESGYDPSATPKPTVSDYLVSFDTNTRPYCVGVVDMVDSTKISATISPSKASPLLCEMMPLSISTGAPVRRRRP